MPLAASRAARNITRLPPDRTICIRSHKNTLAYHVPTAFLTSKKKGRKTAGRMSGYNVTSATPIDSAALMTSVFRGTDG